MLELSILPRPTRPGRSTRHRSAARCVRPAPCLAGSSPGLVTRASSRTSGLPPGGPQTLSAGPRHFSGQREEGEPRSRPPPPPSPPPHVRPGEPCQPRAEESARRPLRRRPKGHRLQRVAEVWAPTPRQHESIPHLLPLGSQVPRRCLAASLIPRGAQSPLGAQCQAGSRRGAAKTSGNPGPCHPLAARGGGRADTGALRAWHMRRCWGCSPSQGPPRSGPSVLETTFPISLWGRAVGTLKKVLAWFSGLDDR